MAINWDIKITDVKLDQGRADLVATRTDTENPAVTKTYTMDDTPLATAEQRLLALNTIKGWVEQDAASVALTRTFVVNWDQAAKAELEAWEATR